MQKKKGKSKYVKCNFGHEFCFECGNAPHGKKKCEEIIDKQFEEWRSHKVQKDVLVVECGQKKMRDVII